MAVPAVYGNLTLEIRLGAAELDTILALKAITMHLVGHDAVMPHAQVTVTLNHYAVAALRSMMEAEREAIRHAQLTQAAQPYRRARRQEGSNTDVPSR